MKLIEVFINGKIHRLSEKALEILGLERQTVKDVPIQMQKLPPDLSIIKIQKKDVIATEVKATEVKATEVKGVEATVTTAVEVKKKEDVTAEGTVKKKRHGRKVGTEK